MTPRLVDLVGIAARDAAIPALRPCHCDAASFWLGDDYGCSICQHKRDVHGSDPASCAVMVPNRLSPAEADRRALLATLREVSE